MLNFTVGPVEIDSDILNIGAEPVPYFRTPEFSKVMLESERMICELAKAPKESRTVFLTGSGTAAMEAIVMNCFTKEDKVLVVEGGGFGTRFVELCEIHQIPYTSIKLEAGKALVAEDLQPFENQGYTGFLVNIHETSTGVYYNPYLIKEFCEKNHLFLAVDAISSFLADAFDMESWGVNVMITGSQKALAVPPGISVIVLDKEAQQRVNQITCKSMYLDLKSALKNGERGQTPFTPAVGILLQIHARLTKIMEAGGYDVEQKKIQNIAEDFREKIKDLPLEIFSESMSNAVTTLKTRESIDAYKVFEVLKDEYQIWVCPNGGELGHKIFRVGHIGDLQIKDNDYLIKALQELSDKGVL